MKIFLVSCFSLYSGKIKKPRPLHCAENGAWACARYDLAGVVRTRGGAAGAGAGVEAGRAGARGRRTAGFRPMMTGSASTLMTSGTVTIPGSAAGGLTTGETAAGAAAGGAGTAGATGGAGYTRGRLEHPRRHPSKARSNPPSRASNSGINHQSSRFAPLVAGDGGVLDAGTGFGAGVFETVAGRVLTLFVTLIVCVTLLHDTQTFEMPPLTATLAAGGTTGIGACTTAGGAVIADGTDGETTCTVTAGGGAGGSITWTMIGPCPTTVCGGYTTIGCGPW
ncbi:MAG: hypothetical protein HYW90_03170 [Candidatus Sungbacteria bacterium]|nr:hypothetical protein [Candidatus Sungbacteria bacterium]